MIESALVIVRVLLEKRRHLRPARQRNLDTVALQKWHRRASGVGKISRLKQIGVRAEIHQVGVRPFCWVADIVRPKHHGPIAEEPLYRIDFVKMGPNARWRIRNLAAADIRSHSIPPVSSSQGSLSLQTRCTEPWPAEAMGAGSVTTLC